MPHPHPFGPAFRSPLDPPRLTPPRPWAPLSHDEWAALAPFLYRADHLPGRRLADARARMDAILYIAAHKLPWHALPPAFGKPDTVARHFRRLAHAGLWQALLKALASDLATKPLKSLEHWLCAACRRATRIVGPLMIALARHLRMDSALRAPHWLLPDPLLSASCIRRTLAADFVAKLRAAPPGRSPLTSILGLLRLAGGQRRIPKCLEPA